MHIVQRDADQNCLGPSSAGKESLPLPSCRAGAIFASDSRGVVRYDPGLDRCHARGEDHRAAIDRRHDFTTERGTRSSERWVR